MWTNGIKIAIALILIMSLTGCSSSAKQKNLINKKPIIVQDYGSGNNVQISQYGDGTYYYRDRQYPGLD